MLQSFAARDTILVEVLLNKILFISRGERSSGCNFLLMGKEVVFAGFKGTNQSTASFLIVSKSVFRRKAAVN